jgi:hypothetical protein
MLLCRPKGQDTKKAPSPRAAALFYATFICRHQFWQRDIIMADQGRQVKGEALWQKHDKNQTFSLMICLTKDFPATNRANQASSHD